MPKTQKKSGASLPRDHYVVGPDLEDMDAASESCEIDAAADREFLKRNPKVWAFVRPISPREIKATGLPRHRIVLVIRLDDGGILRQFTFE